MPMNASENGTAVRIFAPCNQARTWPFNLADGDDIRLTGLIDDVLFCWVVVLDYDILRLRLSHNDTSQLRLCSLLRGAGQIILPDS